MIFIKYERGKNKFLNFMHGMNTNKKLTYLLCITNGAKSVVRDLRGFRQQCLTHLKHVNEFLDLFDFVLIHMCHVYGEIRV